MIVPGQDLLAVACTADRRVATTRRHWHDSAMPEGSGTATKRGTDMRAELGKLWSRLRESNPRPTHYENAAPLPRRSTSTQSTTQGTRSTPRTGRSRFVMPEVMPERRPCPRRAGPAPLVGRVGLSPSAGSGARPGQVDHGKVARAMLTPAILAVVQAGAVTGRWRIRALVTRSGAVIWAACAWPGSRTTVLCGSAS
jgi:hypothetical protein